MSFTIEYDNIICDVFATPMSYKAGEIICNFWCPENNIFNFSAKLANTNKASYIKTIMKHAKKYRIRHIVIKPYKVI